MFVDELYVIVVDIAPELLVKLNPIVPDCTASLNFAVTGDVTDTPVAPEAGVSLVTVGAVGSVVNDHETGAARALPALPVAALIVTV